MQTRRAAGEILRTLGRVFPQRHGFSYFPQRHGFSYSVISPEPDFEALFGRRADKSRKLYNGMLKCRLYMYYK